MVVLLATDTFYPLHGYGAATILNFHVDALTEAGHEVIVLAKNRPGNPDEPCAVLEEKVTVYRYPYPGEDGLPALLKALKGILGGYRRLSARHRPDRLVLEQPLAGFCLSLLPRASRPPTVYSYLSSWYEEHLTRRNPSSAEKAKAWIRRVMEGWALSRADAIFVLSDFSGRNLLGLHPSVKTPIHRLRGAVDTVRFHPPSPDKSTVRESLGLPSGQTIFLTIRNLVPRMGLDTLVSAMGEVAKKRDDWLLFIGGKGPLQPALEKQIRESGLTERIRLLGFIPDERLAAYYQAADAFLLATRCMEGFGLVTVEALACGTPVLGTPVGATPEILEPLDPGMLFDSCDTHALSAKILQFLDAPATFPGQEPCSSYARNLYSQPVVGALTVESLHRLNNGS